MERGGVHAVRLSLHVVPSAAIRGERSLDESIETVRWATDGVLVKEHRGFERVGEG